MDVSGKAAFVTGGGTGVGRATAQALAARGCDVALTYSVSRDEAEATVRDLEGRGVRALAIQSDVADDAACRSAVGTAVEAFGRLDVLVNNAGTTRFIPHDDLEAVGTDVWDRIFAVNVRGPFQCVRAARAALERNGGAVVNISSIAATLADGSSIPYAASKAALNNLTVSLARVLAPKVRVNAVAPGFIQGRWVKRTLGDDYEAAMRRVAEFCPLGAVSTPDDIAAAVMSLVTGSDLVTGQVLVCDGGHLIAKKL